MYFKVNIDTGDDGDKKGDEDDKNKPKTPTVAGGKPPKDKSWENAINAIKKYNDAYNKLLETNDAANAKLKANTYYWSEVEAYAKKAGLAIQNYDITTTEGATAALDMLRKKTKYDDDKKKVGEIILGVKMDEDENIQEELFDKLESKTEGIFDTYEISVELDKLHISKNATKDLFGVEHTSLDELRDKVISMKGDFDALGIKGEEAYKKYLEKISELEAKAQQDRIKKYIEFTRESMGERAKIMLDSFHELQDIESAFTLTETLAKDRGLISDDDISKMHELGLSMSELLMQAPSYMQGKLGFDKDKTDRLIAAYKDLNEQRDIASKYSKDEAERKLQEKDWEMFRGSDTFQLLFSDLTNASDKALSALISQLEKYEDQWDKLPLGQMKQLVKLLQEAKDAQAMLLHPSEVISTAKKSMSESGYDSETSAESAMVAAEIKLIELENELAIVTEIERLRAEGVKEEEIKKELGEKYREVNKDTRENLAKQKGYQEGIVQKAKDYITALNNIRKAYKEMGDRLTKIKSLVDKTFEGWDAINDLFEDDSISKSIAELSKGTSDAVFEAIQLVYSYKLAKEGLKNAGTEAEIFGAKMNIAMGIIGWIVLAIQLISKGLKFAFEAHDKMLQKQIDAQLEDIETLEKSYNKLKESIEDAYSAVDLGKLTREANDNLQSRISKTEELIALEEDKKKSDEDKISDYKDEISDMEAELAENIESTFSTLTDGILDNVIDATRDFVDAWYDAYEETGNGMKGLEESFKEMLLNMLKQQASMQLIAPYIADYKDWLKKYVDPNNGDDELTIDEARAWADQVRATFPEVDSLLSNFFEGAQSILGGEYGELSGLEKGIQGMTEEQAEVLAAYWNSCRFMLSNIDTNLAAIAASVLGRPNNSNPVVEAIQAQTSVITEIKEMFSSVIGSTGYPSGGSYIKTLEG
jgi:hypothetical protein